MTYRNFIVKGKINTETVDDATDILRIILGDYAVIVDRVEVVDKDCSLVEICNQKLTEG